MLRNAVPILLALFGRATTTVLAQVANSQVQACGRGIRVLRPTGTFTIYTDEPTFFNATLSYDPTLCTDQVQIAYIRLWTFDSRTTCRQGPFDGSGTLYTQCAITNGDLAQTIIDEGSDLGQRADLDIRVGSPAYWWSETRALSVNALDAADRPAEPVPSGALRRRKAEDQHVFDCPIGHTYCWTGQNNDYACMDTSSDVTACGRCPYAVGAEESDCTSIDGVDDVECRNSRCVVNACQRGFQVSLDRTKCLDGRKRSLRSSLF